MSLDKAVEHGKEHRRPYRGAKAVDPTCRNHGSDPWCVADRLAGTRRRAEEFEDKIGEHGSGSRSGED